MSEGTQRLRQFLKVHDFSRAC